MTVKKDIVCPNCRAQITVSEDEEGKLTCIPFTGPESKLLAGYLKMRNGLILYVGFDGAQYMRQAAIEKFGQNEVDLLDQRMKTSEDIGFHIGKQRKKKTL